MDPDQTVSIGTVCSRSTLFAFVLNSSVMLGNYLQQTTSAFDIFRCIFFLSPLRVNNGSFFVLHALTEIAKKPEKEKLFCSFIDFSKAFGSVW